MIQSYVQHFGSIIVSQIEMNCLFFLKPFCYKYIYLKLLHELVCNITSYCKWVWYFHLPKASEKAAHECNNHDMHTKECLLSATTTASCLLMLTQSTK